MTTPAPRIRPLRPEDLPRVLAIESLANPHPWPAAQFLAALGNGEGLRLAQVAETEGGVEGFLCAQAAADEMEILSLAVAPERRRRGTGGSLLAAALDWAASRGCAKSYLEVRQGNRLAIAFYRRHGFEDAGMRKAYYASGEDALLLQRDLPHPAGAP